jgi:hypothetical protein
VFTPSVPRGTRSLTIRSADGSGRPVVTFAVPLMSVPDTADMAEDADALDTGYPPELRRPA